jgi:Zn-finger nucleic acid-binding protein
MSERQGVEIDYCPECRGVWLDRGELDKIVERALAEVADARREAVEERRPAPPRPDDRYRDDRYREERDRDDRDRDRHDPYYKKKKKKSFLEDIFEF